MITKSTKANPMATITTQKSFTLTLSQEELQIIQATMQIAMETDCWSYNTPEDNRITDLLYDEIKTCLGTD